MPFLGIDQLLRKWKSLPVFSQQVYQILKLFREGPLTLPGPMTIVQKTPQRFPPTQIKTGSFEFPGNYPAGEAGQQQPPVITIITGGQSQQQEHEEQQGGGTQNRPPKQKPKRDPNENKRDSLDPIIQAQREDGSTTTYALTPTGIKTFNEDGTGENAESVDEPQESSGGGGVPAKVTASSAGSGGTCTVTVDLYESGINEALTQSVNATVLQIADDEQIPTSTWGFASQVGEDWYFSPQGGIWL